MLEAGLHYTLAGEALQHACPDPPLLISNVFPHFLAAGGRRSLDALSTVPLALLTPTSIKNDAFLTLILLETSHS